MPGSCPARSARGGGSGLRPAETERLEDEAAAAGRRMGANQLVVLNVYDMVSAAPGGPCEPADRPAGTGWDPGPFLPGVPASSLVLRCGGRGPSRCLLIPRLAGAPPGEAQSARGRAGARPSSELGSPDCGPDPWAGEPCPPPRLPSPSDLRATAWPPSCPLAPSALLLLTLGGLQMLKSPTSSQAPRV